MAVINGDDDVDDDYQPEIDEIDTQIQANEEEINRLTKEQGIGGDKGLCEKAIDFSTL